MLKHVKTAQGYIFCYHVEFLPTFLYFLNVFLPGRKVFSGIKFGLFRSCDRRSRSREDKRSRSKENGGGSNSGDHKNGGEDGVKQENGGANSEDEKVMDLK